MNCTHCTTGKCRATWPAAGRAWEDSDSLAAIAAGWRIWKGRSGIGDPSLKDGEALCPSHANQPAPSANRGEGGDRG